MPKITRFVMILSGNVQKQACPRYISLNNDTQILLITAEELRVVAETWSKKHPGEIFNLGYFKQNVRFDIKLLNL